MEKEFSSSSSSASAETIEVHDVSRAQFPPDFVFGVATSAYQDDIKMMKSMGLDAYRFSISWSRILPRGRVSEGVNQKGIDYYNDLINTVIANDMKPFVTVFHFDLPHALEEEFDGFLSRDVAEFFREFAELCFGEFGDRVKYWMTLNEPWSYAHNGYVTYEFPPGVDPAIASALAAPPLHSSSTPPLYSSRPDDAALLMNSTSSSSKMMKYIPYRGRPYHQHYHLLNAALAHHAAASNQIMFNSSISSDAKRKRDPAKDAYTVGRNLLLAHALAVHSYRTKFQEHQKGQIGIALNTLWCEPYKKGDADDIEAVKRAMDFVMGWFLEPVLTGKYPKTMIDCVPCENLAAFSDGEAEMLKGSVDFLGLNYYTGVFAANDPNPTHIGYLGDQRLEISFSDATGKALGPQAGSFWLHMYPQGMYNMLIRYVNDKYGDKIPAIYITENGWDEKNDEKLKVKDACVDSMREDYHKSHLVYLLKSMKEMTVPANVKVTLHGRGVIILNGLKDTLSDSDLFI
ncbi:UNVERIFIED_CONTAM: Raucaffricine-O-beta-D-glucosidase [Sesamum radiatum]|uniref:Raucaffricine-O-beta-D-glucosidase n=1 Tax=Sesamum radiatum TaxID=300843 RepID=A0AAW2MG44_SESRA